MKGPTAKIQKEAKVKGLRGSGELTAKKSKDRSEQRAIDNKRLTAKIQKEARDQRARDREARYQRARDKERKELEDKERKELEEIRQHMEEMAKKMMEGRKKAAADRKAYLDLYGHPNLEVSARTFEEKTFGSTDVASAAWLAPYIVSIALFDVNVMLFACSGIAVLRERRKGPLITTIVTSKRLVKEFEDSRNRADALKIKAHFPRNRGRAEFSDDGFLGLYDDDIAIVTCFGFLHGCGVDLNSQGKQLSDFDSVVALGRAFKSGTLMSVQVQRQWIGPEHPPVYTSAIRVGGPVMDKGGNFLGLIINCGTNTKSTVILPWETLRYRLPRFEEHMYASNASKLYHVSSPDCTNMKKYTLPDGLYKIIPSGRWCSVKYLVSKGYPPPPPLMLEAGAQLRNKPQAVFGELYPHEGVNCDIWDHGTGEVVFSKLPRQVVTKICKRVVSLSSYKGDELSFSCTGYLISWHKGGTPVILTSASLIRSPDNEDQIDENLKIDVFLPQNQYSGGILELYHSDYNIAVISLKECLPDICRPEDIFLTGNSCLKKVVAMGREVVDGVLMGTIGELAEKPTKNPSDLGCENIRLSTCKIEKAGIGGPLLNFVDGSYAGMNFYSDTDNTPYLPKSIIKKALEIRDLPSKGDGSLSKDMMGESTVKKNRWSVPKPYWYHAMFDRRYQYTRPEFVGRKLP